MKKNRDLLSLILVMLCVWMPVFMGAWDKDKPASTTSLRSSNPQMLANNAAIETALNREHEFSTGGTVADQAHHKKGSARAYFQDAEPGTRVDSSAFNAQDLGSLWFDTNASPDNTFYVLTATTPTWTPVSTEIIATMVAASHTWAASQTLGAGADLIGSSTSDITFNTNKFTVAGATGNTLVAGTFDIGSSTAVSSILDEDDLSSDLATALITQQSVKAYIDAQGAVQVVNTMDAAVASSAETTPAYDDSIPQSSEGFEITNLQTVITPTSATNKLKIDIVVNLNNSANTNVVVGLFQDSTAGALAAVSHQLIAGEPQVVSFTHYMTAGTTDPTTFKVIAGGSSGTITVNGDGGSRRLGGVMASSVTVTEIGQ